MKDILDARNEINEIDKQMAQLFQKRMEAVKDVAVYKKDNGLSVRDLSREAEVAKRNSKFVTDESLKPYSSTSSETRSTCPVSIRNRCFGI